ncbi:lipid-A-disaccharide synthase [Marivivens sp. LCG002]|uniref:lipid-A-disaccharide synthase n=1 Tax=Marivivens sp. LCG002 TaxID=3051171 RepID=UPI002555478B|nr:lipid-A-disaccharide synthase [Marivivens sp. LCG002]WIV52152.1 lipid-A-disaccharide synthase [Marivivens sp. LCG002]
MKAFVIAGEPSGDKLGGALMEGLRLRVPDITFEGVGGAEMSSHGLTSFFPMDELSIMGIAEVLPKYFHLKRRIRQTAEAVLASRPDVLITIDSPDFCLRVAKLVKIMRPDLRCVHYVAPTVWAWRPGRADKMAKVIDHVLALFPFEPPFMQAAGMDCDFVGHPVATEEIATQDEADAFRARIGGTGPLLLALPGSRRGEVTRLAERFGETVGIVAKQHPDLKVVLPCAAPVAPLVRELTTNWPVTPMLIDPITDPDARETKKAAFRAADVALAASGTVSLELAASGTPMVIAYDMNKVTRFMVKRLLRVDTVTLVNLVAENRTVPEFLGENCIPEGIAAALEKVLLAPEAQRDAMQLTMERLGAGGPPPGQRAADAILARL